MSDKALGGPAAGSCRLDSSDLGVACLRITVMLTPQAKLPNVSRWIDGK